MIPHKTRVKHSPPDSYGDCVRATIASLLDFDDTEDVPHFYFDNPDELTGMARIEEFLRLHGMALFNIYFPAEYEKEVVLKQMAYANPGTYYMLYGRNGTDVPHVVVCLDDKIVHDVSWYPTGIAGANEGGWWQVTVIISSKLKVAAA